MMTNSSAPLAPTPNPTGQTNTAVLLLQGATQCQSGGSEQLPLSALAGACLFLVPLFLPSLCGWSPCRPSNGSQPHPGPTLMPIHWGQRQFLNVTQYA